VTQAELRAAVHARRLVEREDVPGIGDGLGGEADEEPDRVDVVEDAQDARDAGHLGHRDRHRGRDADREQDDGERMPTPDDPVEARPSAAERAAQACERRRRGWDLHEGSVGGGWGHNALVGRPGSMP
jgi:hypothetical protein